MEHKKDTELAILLSAEKEFMLKGLAGARTTQIAKGADVTHTMLHYYFRTKEALFVKVIERKFSFMIEAIEKVLHRKDVDIITKLELLLEAHFNFLVANPRLPIVLLSDFNPGTVTDNGSDNESKSGAKSDSDNKGSSDNKNDKGGESIVVIQKLHDLIIDNCQKEVDQAIEEGRMRPVSLDNILVDVVGLNLASVALTSPFSKMTGQTSQEFLQDRLLENKRTLRYRITP